jgi:para-nitrobenzyl esterase
MRTRLGAHHGEELFFLSDSFPSDRVRTDKDQEFGNVMRRYWLAFAKTGDPDIDGAPHWPPYNSKSLEYFELGRRIGPYPSPNASEPLKA